MLVCVLPHPISLPSNLHPKVLDSSPAATLTTYGFCKSPTPSQLCYLTSILIYPSKMLPRGVLPRPLGLTLGTVQPRPNYPNQSSYLQNGTSGPAPGAQPLLPNSGRIIQNGPTRVLCIADVRGKLMNLAIWEARLMKYRQSSFSQRPCKDCQS